MKIKTPGVVENKPVDTPVISGKNETDIKAVLKVGHRSEKPIVFIILDEYESPVAFDNENKKPNQPSLVAYLDSNGWATKRTFYSAETFTLTSMASIFNYNLSTNRDNYSADGLNANTDILRVKEYLENASVIKDIDKKGIAFENYSYFILNGHPYYKYLYPFPVSFPELFMMNSLYLKVKLNTEGFKLKAFGYDNYTVSNYNHEVFNITNAILNRPGLPRQFFYIHFLMPHPPYRYGNEIALDISTPNYYQYWLFTNKKIIGLLKQAKYLKDYRVIVTGDHGFRGDKKIDPHQTMTAFYGFDKSDINQLKSVQDIGAFISQSFN